MVANTFEGVNEESQAENIERSLYGEVFTWMKTNNTIFTNSIWRWWIHEKKLINQISKVSSSLKTLQL